MIARMIQWVNGMIAPFFSEPRSPGWAKLENEFLRENPACIVCGNTNRKQVLAHHVIPFHVDKSKELDKTNLRTMCRDEYGFRCHLIWGHFSWYELWNPDVDEMAAVWKSGRENAIKTRHSNDSGT